MILQALVQYYESLVKQGKISKPGWCRAKVSYGIELNEDGSVKGIISLKQEVERGKKKVMVPSSICVPDMVTRSSGVKANFLCDNAKYLLGIDEDGVNSRTLECFEKTREKHLEILKESEGTMAKAIYQYFKTWNPQRAKEIIYSKEQWDEVNDGGNLIFLMRNQFAQENEKIKQIWEKQMNQEIEGQIGRCLVTGEKTEIARIHHGIKGVPGAQSSGAALVSFNEKAFESFGKEQSYNAPVGKYAEFAYTTALNYLLNQREFRFSLGDSMIVFWAESGKEEYQSNFLSWLAPPKDNQKEMKKVFGNLTLGKRVDLSDINLDMSQKFYILCLAPNAARLSVRFFYQNSFGDILENLAAHYRRMGIVRPAWEDREYLGIRELLDETINKKSKDKTPIPNMAAMVLRSILENTRYPNSLYMNTLMRIRAEQGNITYGRAAIIKANLIKNYKWKEGEKYMRFNKNCEEEAYVLGCVFAVLESIQRDANPGINATIKDRYFNSACTKPASIFPILFKLENSHMRKIERESAGAKIYYERLLTELLGKLSVANEKKGFPKQFSLEEQGKFILGYYHQMQKKYEKKGEK